MTMREGHSAITGYTWPQKASHRGATKCRRAGLGVESHAHLLSAKAIIERIGVGRVYAK